MKNIHKNQKGFSVVEGVLISIILGIIVFTAWYVWRSMNQADENLSSADSTSNSIISGKKSTQQPTSNSSGKKSSGSTPVPASPVPAAIVSPAPAYVTTTPTVINNYITINEWRVKFKHNGSITIMYAHDSKDSKHRSAFFSSSELSSKNKACKAEFYPAGYIVRYKSDEKVADAKGEDNKKTASEYASNNNDDQGKTYKQVGDYYYFYRGPVAKCAELKEIQDLQNQTAEAVKAFLASLEAA